MKHSSPIQRIVFVAGGILLFVVLLEMGLRAGGWLLHALQEHRNAQTLARPSDYRILCLGESTTARQWPGPLEELLNERDLGMRVSVIDKGVVGTNTGAILTHVPRYIETYKLHMIIAMMGINDTWYASIMPAADTPAFSFTRLKVYTLARLLALTLSRIVDRGSGGAGDYADEAVPGHAVTDLARGMQYLEERQLDKAKEAFHAVLAGSVDVETMRRVLEYSHAQTALDQYPDGLLQKGCFP